MTLATTPSSTDLEVREEVFSLLMDLYTFFSPPPGGGGDRGGGERKKSKEEKVKERLTYCLVKGLSDPDERGLEAVEEEEEEEEGKKKKGIRRRVIDMWDASSSSSSSPLTRLDLLLPTLFHPACASSLLPSTSYLLLSLSLASPSSSSLLFPHPLDATAKFTALSTSSPPPPPPPPPPPTVS